MKFLHQLRVDNNEIFIFDINYKYDITVEHRDFKPNGFCLSPIKADENSYTFLDFAKYNMNNIYSDKKIFFEIDDNISKKLDKILIIHPDDVPKIHKLYRKNYGGVLFKPCDFKLRLKYFWYSESISV